MRAFYLALQLGSRLVVTSSHTQTEALHPQILDPVVQHDQSSAEVPAAENDPSHCVSAVSQGGSQCAPCVCPAGFQAAKQQLTQELQLKARRKTWTNVQTYSL